MTYPSQPGQPDNWPDPSWPSAQGPGYPDPGMPGSPVAYSPQSVPPGYGVPPGYAQPYPYPTSRPTNGMAIAALVLSLSGLFACGVTSLVGAILGHVARSQIRERGEEGDGLALGAIIAGWIITGLYVVIIAIYIIIIAFAMSESRDATYSFLH